MKCNKIFADGGFMICQTSDSEKELFLIKLIKNHDGSINHDEKERIFQRLITEEKLIPTQAVRAVNKAQDIIESEHKNHRKQWSKKNKNDKKWEQIDLIKKVRAARWHGTKKY